MKVAVVILNWNGKYFLEKFLPTVIAYSQNSAEVFVIDNNSSDGSVGYIHSHFPSVTIIKNNDNYGFAKGYNEGLKKIQAEYYILLNSDVEVTQNWIEPMLNLLESDKNIAACQPKILNYNVPDEFEYAGGSGGYIDKWGYPFCRGRIFNSFEKDTGQYNDTIEIFWASGACLFIRADNYFNAGGFDEDFFAHMEEIDLCWRIQNMGFRIMCCSTAVIFHIGAGTLAKMNPQKTFYNFRNNLSLLCKNHSSEFFYFKLFQRGILDGLAGIKFLISGDADHFFAVVRAHLSFYRLFPTMLEKRKIIQANVKHYATTGVYKGSIVWEYFVEGKRKFSELNKKYF